MSVLTEKVALVGDDVARWAAVRPDDEALTYGDRTWSWRQWNARIHAVAGVLRDLGIVRGDVVATIDKNHPSSLETTLACGLLGAAHAVANWRLSPDELVYVLNDCGARVLVVGAEFSKDVRALQDRLPSVDRIITVEGPDSEFDALVASVAPVTEPDPKVTEDDPVLVLYTSGTTGFPKGAQLSHRSIKAHTAAASTAFVMEPGDRNLVAMPLFHVGGHCYALLGFEAGVPTTLAREAAPEVLFPALVGATHAFLVPALIQGVLAAGDMAIAALSGLKLIAYGASPMPLPLLEKALVAWPDADFFQVYGMTEMSGIITTLDAQAHRDTEHPQRLVSAGRPLPGIDIRVVGPDGNDVAAGDGGEFWVRSDQLMTGYLGKPEATREAITQDGWLRTGDAGHLDEDGFVYIEDRVKDMIISGGENIYSPEVERVLLAHPDIAEAAVIGVPDDQWGEAVKAVVVPLDGTDVDAEGLIAWTRERLAHYKCPRSVDFVKELPRNSTMKVLKRDLRAPHWADRGRSI